MKRKWPAICIFAGVLLLTWNRDVKGMAFFIDLVEALVSEKDVSVMNEMRDDTIVGTWEWKLSSSDGDRDYAESRWEQSINNYTLMGIPFRTLTFFEDGRFCMDGSENGTYYVTEDGKSIVLVNEQGANYPYRFALFEDRLYFYYDNGELTFLRRNVEHERILSDQDEWIVGKWENKCINGGVLEFFEDGTLSFKSVFSDTTESVGHYKIEGENLFVTDVYGDTETVRCELFENEMCLYDDENEFMIFDRIPERIHLEMAGHPIIGRWEGTEDGYVISLEFQENGCLTIKGTYPPESGEAITEVHTAAYELTGSERTIRIIIEGESGECPYFVNDKVLYLEENASSILFYKVD